MADFKVGDVVRIETDKADSLKLVIRGIDPANATNLFLCVSKCGRRIRWSAIEEMELVSRPDPQADLVQAIREVLLSDEFMAKFAAAWMKTPIPYVHDISFDNLKPGETLTGNYVWLGEPAKEATDDPA